MMDIDRINEIAYEQMAHRKTHPEREPGFIYFHGRRVGLIACKLADRLHSDADRDILYVSGLFHDIGKGYERHNEVGAQMTWELLSSSFPTSHLEKICQIIMEHNYREIPSPYSLETQMVQDADLLDHIGPMQPWLTFYWNATHQENIQDTLRYQHSEENIRFYEWMRSVVNLDISAQVFDQRVEYERKFFAELERVQMEGL